MRLYLEMRSLKKKIRERLPTKMEGRLIHCASLHNQKKDNNNLKTRNNQN